MDDTKAGQWAKLADLSEADMAVITSLEALGVPVRKKGTAGKSKIFSRKPRAKNTRKVYPALWSAVNVITLPILSLSSSGWCYTVIGFEWAWYPLV